MTARTVLRTLVSAGVVSLATVAPAFADWTLTGFVGAAHTRTSSLTLTRPTEATDVVLSPIRYASESLKLPPYYGYRAAFFPRSGWFGIEGELIHVKVVADTTRAVRMHGTWRRARVDETVRLSSVIQDFSITHGVNLLLVNAVVRRRTGAILQEMHVGPSPRDSALADPSLTRRVRLADGISRATNGAR
jgi:hypothetical protein